MRFLKMEEILMKNEYHNETYMVHTVNEERSFESEGRHFQKYPVNT